MSPFIEPLVLTGNSTSLRSDELLSNACATDIARVWRGYCGRIDADICVLGWQDFCLPSGRRRQETKKKNSWHCSVVLCENWKLLQVWIFSKVAKHKTFIGSRSFCNCTFYIYTYVVSQCIYRPSPLFYLILEQTHICIVQRWFVAPTIIVLVILISSTMMQTASALIAP